MDSSNLELKQALSRLGYSRVRILSSNPFFGTVLYNIEFRFEKIDSISTDGRCIFVDPSFVLSLSDYELDYMIAHQLMHIVLKHPFRKKKGVDEKLFAHACDIVVNSNLMYAAHLDKPILLKGRAMPYLAPNGKDGYLYSAEEIYAMLAKKYPPKPSNDKKEGEESDEDSDEDESKEEDNSIIGETVERKTLIGTVKSSKAERLYLKEGHFQNHDGSNEFGFNDGVDDLFDEEARKNISSLLKDKLKAPLVNTVVSFDKETSDMPSLYYEDASLRLELIPKQSIGYKHAYFKLSDKNIAEIKALSKKANKALAKENEYVRDNYLYLSDKHKEYFDEVFSSFDKNDPYLEIKIRNYIASSAIYNVKPSNECPSDKDFVLFFLKESKEGFCTHFATAVMMAYRYFGIPSRVSVGLMLKVGKDKEELLYAEDAHAWTEIYLDNVGWVSVDATPVVGCSSCSSASDGKDDKKKKDEKNKDEKKKDNKGSGTGTSDRKSDDPRNQDGADSHDKWVEETAQSYISEDEVNNLIVEGSKLSESLGKNNMPKYARDLAVKLRNPNIDWRVLLNDFIQDEINDYSFSPPDRRISYCDFLLPDFNEADTKPKDVVFMADISGSMDMGEISEVASEIKGAIDQFDGKLKGHVGLFDVIVEKFGELESFGEEFYKGVTCGGGTSFDCIFDFIKKRFKDELPDKVIILTDGEAIFPAEKDTMGINVLWVINNDRVMPPYGKTIRKIKA